MLRRIDFILHICRFSKKCGVHTLNTYIFTNKLCIHLLSVLFILKTPQKVYKDEIQSFHIFLLNPHLGHYYHHEWRDVIKSRFKKKIPEVAIKKVHLKKKQRVSLVKKL